MARDEPAEESSGQTYEGELARFAADLTALRIEQGKPSLREIARHAPAGRALSESGVSEALSGRRLPSIDFLIALVKTLLTLGNPQRRPPADDDPRLEHWRQRWTALQRLQVNERRHRLTTSATAVEERPPVRRGTTAGAPGKPLRCFVAMPGETMGASTAWSDVTEIREQLLEPVARLIGEQTGREVTLVIEKEKTTSGVIHRSMFGEARDAEIYIADLTGANPNVYLELGVRWATRDNVTIVICQDLAEVRFNPLIVRIIEYGRNRIAESVRRITQAALDGLEHTEFVDSPVRDMAPAVVMSLEDLNAMRQEHADMAAALEHLRRQLGEDLVLAARNASDSRRRVLLLEKAVEQNPASWQAHFELGLIFRREGKNAEAVQTLRIATELRPDHAPAWRELGTALGKMSGSMIEATAAFERALALDDSDAETWATQGGLLRRLARTTTPGALDESLLDRALTCYRRAAELAPNQLYPLMNAARIELLLAGCRRTNTAPVRAKIENIEYLARFAVNSSGQEPWAAFDLADILLLTGRTEEGLKMLRVAADLCPPEQRTAILITAAEPMNDLLTVAAALEPGVSAALREAIELCKTLAFRH
ncbi:tetratricopeptide repeat-containing protein [Micromonospora sp. NPDC047134]|uniref:tetratricopeptide repeat-containing protein n=1 Tax=Micromonospora sp. NPDC047134 TaxID=3154340 RepID=UPI0033E3FAC5